MGDYYAAKDSFYLQATRQAFNDAGFKIAGMKARAGIVEYEMSKVDGETRL